MTKKSMEELSDHKMRRHLEAVNRHTANCLRDIDEICKDYIDFCKREKYEPGKTLCKIMERVRDEMQYLEWKNAELRAMREAVPKEQERLEGWTRSAQ